MLEISKKDRMTLENRSNSFEPSGILTSFFTWRVAWKRNKLTKIRFINTWRRITSPFYDHGTHLQALRPNVDNGYGGANDEFVAFDQVAVDHSHYMAQWQSLEDPRQPVANLNTNFCFFNRTYKKSLKKN